MATPLLNIMAKVSSTDNALKAVMDAIQELTSHDVLIGIPEDANGRQSDQGNNKATNADLLFIHTNGSPVNHIPARPVLEPAIEHDKDRVAAELKKAIDVAVTGNKEGVLPALERAGQYGENLAKAGLPTKRTDGQRTPMLRYMAQMSISAMASRDQRPTRKM